MFQPRYTVNVRGLAAPEPPADARGGVTVAVQAIARNDWRRHRDIAITLQWQATDTGSTVSPGQTKGLGTNDLAPLSHLETAEVALLPLPVFIVRIVNKSGHAVPLAGASIALTDGLGHRFPWIEARDLVLARAEKELVSRYPILNDPQKREPLEWFRRAQSEVTILSHDTIVPDGGDVQGYIVFNLDTASLEELRAFMTGARRVTLELALAGEAPFHFAFALERKQPGVVCPDGKRRGNITECPDQEWATAPVDDGPCIQSTRKRRTVASLQQWWVGGVPVANSDLHRTLLTDPLTHTTMRRSLVLQGTGYAFIGGGLLGMAIVTPAIATHYGRDNGLYGLTAGVLSVVGIVLVALGNRAQDRAFALYNQQADVTGLCAPVW